MRGTKVPHNGSVGGSRFFDVAPAVGESSSGVVHSGLHGAFGDAEVIGDVPEIHFSVADEAEHLAFFFGQFVDEAVEELSSFGVFVLLIRTDGGFVDHPAGGLGLVIFGIRIRPRVQRLFAASFDGA